MPTILDAILPNDAPNSRRYYQYSQELCNHIPCFSTSNNLSQKNKKRVHVDIWKSKLVNFENWDCKICLISLLVWLGNLWKICSILATCFMKVNSSQQMQNSVGH